MIWYNIIFLIIGISVGFIGAAVGFARVIRKLFPDGINLWMR